MTGDARIEVIAKAVKDAFYEGYGSYATACGAMNTVEEAWAESEAKDAHDAMLAAVRT